MGPEHPIPTLPWARFAGGGVRLAVAHAHAAAGAPAPFFAPIRSEIRSNRHRRLGLEMAGNAAAAGGGATGDRTPDLMTASHKEPPVLQAETPIPVRESGAHSSPIGAIRSDPIGEALDRLLDLRAAEIADQLLAEARAEVAR